MNAAVHLAAVYRLYNLVSDAWSSAEAGIEFLKLYIKLNMLHLFANETSGVPQVIALKSMLLPLMGDNTFLNDTLSDCAPTLICQTFKQFQSFPFSSLYLDKFL